MRAVGRSGAPIFALAVLLAFSPFQDLLRLAFPGSLVILLWRDVLAYGLAVTCLARAVVRRQGLPRHWVTFALSGFILWGLVFILPSQNVLIGLYGFRTVVRYAPLYFVTLWCLRGEHDIRLLSKSMLFAPVVLTAIGVYQWFDPTAFIFRMFEEIAPLYQRFGSRAIFGVYFPRIDSLYVSSVDAFAIYITSCIGLVLHARQTASRRSRRFLLSLIAAAMAFVIVFSSSRMAWAGLALVLAVMARPRRRIRIPRWVLLCAAASPLLYLTFFPEPGHPSFPRELIDRSIYQIQQYPSDPLVLLFGNGYAFSGYTEGVPQAFQVRVLVPGTTDSQWLWTLVQVGGIATTFLVLTVVGFIAAAYRMHRRYRRGGALVPPSGLIWQPTPILGTMLLVALASFHQMPLLFHGLDVNFYVLGAFAVWYQRRRRKASVAPAAPTSGDTPGAIEARAALSARVVTA